MLGVYMNEELSKVSRAYCNGGELVIFFRDIKNTFDIVHATPL
jgi:hypothetical protein